MSKRKSTKRKNLAKKKAQIKEIMNENNRQRKVDKIVRDFKYAMEIYKRESVQGKVDEIVAKQKNK